MALRDELLAEVGGRTHVAELCGRAADELLIKEMKIEQQGREIEKLKDQVDRALSGWEKAQDKYIDLIDVMERKR